MDTAFYLADVDGSRLTGSPNGKAAGERGIKKMKERGLANRKMESWGPFGRGAIVLSHWRRRKRQARQVRHPIGPMWDTAGEGALHYSGWAA